VAIESLLQPDVQVTLDHHGVVTKATVANDIADESVEAWLGRPWAETVEGQGRSQIATLLGSAANEEISSIVQLTQRFPSGLVVPIEYLAIPGSDGGVVAIGRDVRAVAQLQSRLAAAQQTMERGYWQLRDAENRYRTMFEASNDSIAIVSGDGYAITEANPAAITALGLATARPQDIVGRSLIELVDPVDRVTLEATLKRALERGKAPRIMVRLTRSDTTWLLRASLVDADRGRQLLVHLVPAGEDGDEVTNRGDVDVSPAQLFDLAPDGILVIDADGYVVGANASFVRMVQCTAQAEVVGRSLGQWMRPPGGDLQMLLDSLQDLTVARLFPTTLYGGHGGRVAAEVAAVRLSESDTAMYGIYLRDVSQRMDARKSNARFGRLLDSLSAQLGKASLKDLVNTSTGLVERHFIEAALSATGGNRTNAAKLLRVSRQGLYTRLARYGLSESDSED
jgi:transcriptional regulator PpsR